MFNGSYHPARGRTLEHVPYPEWFQFLIHLPSLMHLHGETISVKGEKHLFALQGWEMDEGQTLSQFCLTFDKESWGEADALLSLAPLFNKAPIEGKKTADAPFLFTLRGKYLTLRLSLKGQASQNLMETPFRIHTYRAMLGSVSPAIIFVTITFPWPGGWIWAPEVYRMSEQHFDLLIVVNIDGHLTLCCYQKCNLCLLD